MTNGFAKVLRLFLQTAEVLFIYDLFQKTPLM